MGSKFLAISMAIVALASTVNHSLAAEKVTVATAGKAFFNYLPITLAEKLGAFTREGLDVQVNDFQGGPKSLEALVGRSVDIAIVTYDNVALLQTKGISLVSITLLNHSIGGVIAVRKDLAAKYKSPRDLKGLSFGVTSAGSALQRMLVSFLAKDGVTLDNVSVVGIGGGSSAVAALQSGRLDGFAHVDPVLSEVLKDGNWKILADGRTEEGMKQIYGGFIAATAVVTTLDYMNAHRQTTQKFVDAMVRTLKWMKASSVDEIMALVPPEFYGSDKAAYRNALAAQLPIFSKDGVLDDAVAERTYKSMFVDGALKAGQTVELKRTYDNSFADAANSR
jgi:NitT/TauT family transport system substrate-binding protein